MRDTSICGSTEKGATSHAQHDRNGLKECKLTGVLKGEWSFSSAEGEGF